MVFSMFPLCPTSALRNTTCLEHYIRIALKAQRTRSHAYANLITSLRNALLTKFLVSHGKLLQTYAILNEISARNFNDHLPAKSLHECIIAFGTM